MSTPPEPRQGAVLQLRQLVTSGDAALGKLQDLWPSLQLLLDVERPPQPLAAPQVSRHGT